MDTNEGKAQETQLNQYCLFFFTSCLMNGLVNKICPTVRHCILNLALSPDSLVKIWNVSYCDYYKKKSNFCSDSLSPTARLSCKKTWHCLFTAKHLDCFLLWLLWKKNKSSLLFTDSHTHLFYIDSTFYFCSTFPYKLIQIYIY